MAINKTILKNLLIILILGMKRSCFWFEQGRHFDLFNRPKRQFGLFDRQINQMNSNFENNLKTIDRESDKLLNYHESLFQRNSFNNMFNDILDGFSISEPKNETSNKLKYQARKNSPNNTQDQEKSNDNILSKIESSKQNSIEIIPITPDPEKLTQNANFNFKNNSKWRINSTSNNYSSTRIKHSLLTKNNNKILKTRSLLMTSRNDKNKKDESFNLEAEQNEKEETLKNLNIDVSKSFKTLFKDNKGKLLHIYSDKVPIKKKNNRIKIWNINRTQIIRKPRVNNIEKSYPTYLIVKDNNFHLNPQEKN